MSNDLDPANITRDALYAEVIALRQEIAELQQTIQGVRADADRYRTIADYTSNWEYWLDPGGNFVYVSPACERITGYAPTAFYVDPYLLETIIHPDDRMQMHDHLHDMDNLADIHESTFRITTRSGAECWIGHTCQAVYDAQGHFLGRRASNHDITRRILVEQQLHQQVQLFTNLINTLPFPVFYKDGAGIYRGCNQVFARDVLGKSCDMVLGKGLDDLLPADQVAFYQQLDMELFQRGGSQVYEHESTFADGSRHTVIFHKSVFQNPDGTLGGIIGSMIDITDLKRTEQALRHSHAELEQRVIERTNSLSQVVDDLHRAIASHQRTEEALRRSEKRYREITELISDSVYSVSMNADQTFELEWGFNGLEALTGYTLDELPAQNWLELVHPDDLDLVAQRTARLYAGQEVESDYRLVGKNGEIRLVRDHGRPVWDEQQQRVVRIYGALKDVTLYWQASTALRESEELFRQLMENTHQVFWMRDSTRQQMLYVSPAYAQIWGRSCESLYQNPNSFIDAVHPDDRDHVIAAFRHQDKGVEFDQEYRIVRPDGAVRWVWARTFPIQGATHRTAGIAEDITQRKYAEASLRESEVRMRILLSAIPDMVFRIDQYGIFVDFKSPRDDMLLLPPDAFLGRHYQDVLPPSISAQLSDGIVRAHRSGKVERIEYDLISGDGDRSDFEARVVVGADNHTFCVVRNISDYKRSEERIRQHADRADALIRVATRLNSQLKLDTVLRTVCEETRQALHGDIVVICLYDQHQDALIVADGIGIPPEMIPLINPTPLTLMENQTPVCVVHDLLQIRAIAPNKQLAESLDVRSLMRALMLRDHEMVGMLVCMVMHEERQFSEDEQLLIGGIAAQAAQAITNARLFATVEQERALLSRRIAERTADLIRSNEDLAHAVQAKDEFLANMSHELRTPLNTILGMSEALQEQIYGGLNERQQRAITSIEQSGQHLLALINDILDLSKIESGHIELHSEPVKLSILCQASLQFIKQQALKKGIDVSLHIDTSVASRWHAEHAPKLESKNTDMIILVDQRRLKQILINLLTNAVKFTPDRGKIGLDVSIDVASHVISFSVWDTGIGIAIEDQQRLFQPFIQVDSSLSREYEGTGLGLALVLRLTELHGGSITLESELGKGSRFTVSLPQFQAARPDPPTWTDLVQEVARGGDSAVGTRINDLFSRHQAGVIASDLPLILLAEDNEASILTLLDYLYTKGYHVVVARNGLEAILYAEEYQPALILMDIQMPKMDGLTAIRRIRANTQIQHIPIIALTALAMRGDRERCLEAGASEYMSKPVRLRELAQMVEECLTSLIHE